MKGILKMKTIVLTGMLILSLALSPVSKALQSCSGNSTDHHGCSYTEDGNNSETTCPTYYLTASCQCDSGGSESTPDDNSSGTYVAATQCGWNGSNCSNSGGDCSDPDHPYQASCSCD